VFLLVYSVINIYINVLLSFKIYLMTYINTLLNFLANRINGRAYMLHCCCLHLSVSLCHVCSVAKRCVLEQKLLLPVYRKSYTRIEESIGIKMNYIDLCIEVV